MDELGAPEVRPPGYGAEPHRGSEPTSVRLRPAAWTDALLWRSSRSTEQAGAEIAGASASGPKARRVDGRIKGGRAGGRPQAAAGLDLIKQHITTEAGQFHRDGGDSTPPGDGKGSHLAGFAEGWVRRRANGLLAQYPIRGLWFKDTNYGPLRNAAWLVRNSRVGQGNNPLALRVVVAEIEKLLGEGEQLSDVVEALCELLVHP